MTGQVFPSENIPADEDVILVPVPPSRMKSRRFQKTLSSMDMNTTSEPLSPLRKHTMVSIRGFEWVDVVAQEISPQYHDFMNQLAKDYDLHPATINDCLSPVHQPKIQQFAKFIFLITRFCDENAPEEADTVQQLTNKIAMFISDKAIITIHRSEFSEFMAMRENWQEYRHHTNFHILNKMLHKILETYDECMNNLELSIDEAELRIFTYDKNVLKTLYQLKRRASVFKHMLFLTQEIVNKYAKIATNKTIHPSVTSTLSQSANIVPSGNFSNNTPMAVGNEVDPFVQSLIDTCSRNYYKSDELHENTNNLLNLFLGLASHRTNELVSLLTIFSVFFIPLTFLCGIYGMNFDILPELHYKYGYLLFWIGVLIIVFCLASWLKWNGFILRGWPHQRRNLQVMIV